ncbi:metal-dependent hydrolase [Azospirillum sp. B4]|uniref:metal-dependent hydrolase n=1 Tax=Azospirillum sp. B4 TaxID=95605 RepID=UPI00034AB62C|nr:metal-dependent hydrolase [Azospirillum sp. B4]
MRVRLPKIDYANVRPHWAPNWEFAHSVNASSTIPAFVEPYLIKVMKLAKEVLPPAEEELHRDIDIFIAQEAQHFRQHNGFNRRIRESYPDIAPHETKLGEDYEVLLRERSLKFNLAYCEGFESLGPPAAMMWFEKYDDFLVGADPEAIALWKWHMGEEFEHRTVCYRLFHALYARSLWGRFWNGWLYRVYGFIYAVRHLGTYSKMVRKVLVDTDRRSMDEAALAQSRTNAQTFAEHLKRHTLPQLVKVLSPFYDPGTKPEPRGLSEYLRRFEKGGDMGIPSVG